MWFSARGVIASLLPEKLLTWVPGHPVGDPFILSALGSNTTRIPYRVVTWKMNNLVGDGTPRAIA